MTWRPASRRCRWGIHDWHDTGAMRGLWTLVDQCARCESWRTTNALTETVMVYPPGRGRINHQSSDLDPREDKEVVRG